jgi:outer membrane lipoprotein SlyB
MKRDIFILLSALLMAVMLQGCGSTKGYSGSKLQDSEVARIESGIHKLKVKKRNSSEQALLVKVDTLTVGSYMKGFPKYVEVKPGETTIEIRHFCQWNDKSAAAGAMFGLIGASIAESNNPHTHYKITFPTEKGKVYVVMPETNEETLEPLFVIVDKATNARMEPSRVVKIVKKDKDKDKDKE